MPADFLSAGAHRRLADYFEPRRLSPRKAEELPWQLARAAEWAMLVGLLADPAFLQEAWGKNQYEVRSYWVEVESHSSFRMVEAYREILDQPNEHGDHTWRIATLLDSAGYYEESSRLRSCLVEKFRRFQDQTRLQASLGNQANVLCRRGDLDGAMTLYKEEEQICRKFGILDGLQSCLGNQALVLSIRGNLDGAGALYRNQERICRPLRISVSLRRNLDNQAIILKKRANLDEALAKYQEEEQICIELSDMENLQRSLTNQAIILQGKGNLDAAMALYREAERICRQVGLTNGLAVSLANLALICQRKGHKQEALKMIEEAQDLVARYNHKDLAGQIAPILDNIRRGVQPWWRRLFRGCQVFRIRFSG